MTNKKYFTTREIMERFIEEAEQHEQDERPEDVEIVNTVSNSNYYIVYYSEAKEAFEEFSVWEALEKVQQFENDHFGKVLTDLSDPTNVANTLWYILVEEFAIDYDIYEYDTMSELIEELEKELESLKD